MISHVFIGITDFERALPFYAALMTSLGLEQKFVDRANSWAGWKGRSAVRPLFVISKPFDGEPHVPGNGQMVALMAASRAMVDAAHTTALAQGGSCQGPPGLRPHYHPNFYGAYFRDLDGNKLCVCCHD